MIGGGKELSAAPQQLSEVYLVATTQLILFQNTGSFKDQRSTGMKSDTGTRRIFVTKKKKYTIHSKHQAIVPFFFSCWDSYLASQGFLNVVERSCVFNRSCSAREYCDTLFSSV